MNSTGINSEIQGVAVSLLDEEKVELVIGYAAGSLPLRTTPVFVRRLDEAKKLIWNPLCENNLARYLNKFKSRKVGIVAKGCDVRAIIGLLQERQIERENVHIIGVPCVGVVDRKKVERALEGSEIIEARIKGSELLVKTTISENKFSLDEIVHDTCLECVTRNPSMHDTLVGEKAPELENIDEFAEVKKLMAMSADERWEYFRREMQKCILCYACREACPLCFCNECFIDCSQPKWSGKSDKESDVQFFQITRMFHLAGRCVGCGACSRACPMDVKLWRYLNKLRHDAKELFDYEAGVDENLSPPLTTYKENDPDEFIK